MTKYLTIVSLFLFVLIFQDCVSGKHVHGKYAGGFAGIAEEQILLNEKPDSFEYFFRSEGGLLNYSTGSWKQLGKQVFLYGYSQEKLKELEVESEIQSNLNENKDKIVINYRPDPLFPYVRLDLWLNDSYNLSISGDTTLWIESNVKIIQLKCFLNFNEALVSSAPKIDTLFSEKIKTEKQNTENTKKAYVLHVLVNYKHFYRTELNDTLLIRNNRTLIKGKRKLKKINI